MVATYFDSLFSGHLDLVYTQKLTDLTIFRSVGAVKNRGNTHVLWKNSFINIS